MQNTALSKGKKIWDKWINSGIAEDIWRGRVLNNMGQKEERKKKRVKSGEINLKKCSPRFGNVGLKTDFLNLNLIKLQYVQNPKSSPPNKTIYFLF
ncbi:hypothetical protein XELAEV_18046342mg [Xenopus laevis]|uniref:Uncharacterized protein n=1 Tax=Xenopus laevis TaxID=8355 RepID=A0A974BT61_XENLA|nr:hypothetical protein XELAEV_18046342mg [Xenopus laevis]